MRSRAAAAFRATAAYTRTRTNWAPAHEASCCTPPLVPSLRARRSSGCCSALAPSPPPPTAAADSRVRPLIRTHATAKRSSSVEALAPPLVAPQRADRLVVAMSASSSSSFRDPRAEEDRDIEDLHRNAVLNNQETYRDPRTGLTVFTELAHKRRGYCCGSRCRHCPYTDWSGRSTGLEAVATPPEEEEETDAAPAARASTNSDRRTKGKKNVPYTRTGDKGTAVLLTGERRSKSDDAFQALGTVDELCATVGVAHAMILQQLHDAEGKEAGTTPRPSPPASSSDGSGDDPTAVSENPIAVSTLEDWLLQVMSRLFDVGSHLAKPKRVRRRRLDDDGEDEDIDDASSTSSSSSEGFAPDGIGGGLDSRHVDDLEEWIDALTADLPELRHFVLPSGSVASAQLHVARCVCRRAERGVVNLVARGSCDPSVLRYLNRLSDFLFVAARWINQHQGGPEFRYQRPAPGATQRNVVVSPNKS